MQWIRVLLAVVVGYALAAVANMFWVMRFHMPDRTPMGALIVLGTGIVLLASGLVAGLAARAIGRRKWRAAVSLTAALLLAAGVLNLVLAAGVEPPWHTVIALITQPVGVLWAGLQRQKTIV